MLARLRAKGVDPPPSYSLLDDRYMDNRGTQPCITVVPYATPPRNGWSRALGTNLFGDFSPQQSMMKLMQSRRLRAASRNGLQVLETVVFEGFRSSHGARQLGSPWETRCARRVAP